MLYLVLIPVILYRVGDCWIGQWQLLTSEPCLPSGAGFCVAVSQDCWREKGREHPHQLMKMPIRSRQAEGGDENMLRHKEYVKARGWL